MLVEATASVLALLLPSAALPAALKVPATDAEDCSCAAPRIVVGMLLLAPSMLLPAVVRLPSTAKSASSCAGECTVSRVALVRDPRVTEPETCMSLVKVEAPATTKTEPKSLAKDTFPVASRVVLTRTAALKVAGPPT